MKACIPAPETRYRIVEPPEYLNGEANIDEKKKRKNMPKARGRGRERAKTTGGQGLRLFIDRL